ncbi:MAG TPA: hypothetical protein VM553_01025 [Dongiaceae bacterium]|nr:hypothetical protein [Dongiaceae bacterium]
MGGEIQLGTFLGMMVVLSAVATVIPLIVSNYLSGNLWIVFRVISAVMSVGVFVFLSILLVFRTYQTIPAMLMTAITLSMVYGYLILFRPWRRFASLVAPDKSQSPGSDL